MYNKSYNTTTENSHVFYSRIPLKITYIITIQLTKIRILALVEYYSLNYKPYVKFTSFSLNVPFILPRSNSGYHTAFSYLFQFLIVLKSFLIFL